MCVNMMCTCAQYEIPQFFAFPLLVYLMSYHLAIFFLKILSRVTPPSVKLVVTSRQRGTLEIKPTKLLKRPMLPTQPPPQLPSWQYLKYLSGHQYYHYHLQYHKKRLVRSPQHQMLKFELHLCFSFMLLVLKFISYERVLGGRGVKFNYTLLQVGEKQMLPNVDQLLFYGYGSTKIVKRV